MAKRLEGRAAVVTGAGRGIGRAIAELLAAEGAAVVVNDLGAEVDGRGASRRVADEVVEAIRARGGRAVANADSVADFAAAERIVETAVKEFGAIDILVNNAGILRDRMIFNMSEEEWDAVIAVHQTARAVRAERGLSTGAGERRFPLRNFGPENVAPWVVYLATDAAKNVNGQLFLVMAGMVALLNYPAPVRTIAKDGRWTPEEIATIFPHTLGQDLPNPAPPRQPWERSRGGRAHVRGQN